jgi:intracellular multiplication protein IcmO
MAFNKKKYGAYGGTAKQHFRDVRPLYARIGEAIATPTYTLVICLIGVYFVLFLPFGHMFADILLIIYVIFFFWLKTRDRTLPAKMPLNAPYQDGNNMGPGQDGDAEGILFIGNEKSSKQQIWYSNSDARTHILYLGTTGSGKTEGLKSFVTSAMSWGSGFVYIDGKADTDLWSSLSSLIRRFGRDDDLLVLNYMTGNSDARAPSNTLNPFSSGSASYLTQMLISLMPEAEGDNAMWKERAVSLLSSLMPALTFKRDNQDFPLSVNSIRNYLNLNYIIKLSRDETLPEKIREGLIGYLDTLPGYIDSAFDDEGKEKPVGPDQPAVDTTTVRQQHGYLTMQFTRALQSLGDDYGYIFDTQAADIDMVDVVLNRRFVIVLIPALEKSGDETANLGKIIAATIKGMMGSTLGSALEGSSSSVIENKPTHSATPFMTVFDEVGYYATQGMAVMAAQARSLGFCLIFSAQDLQAMEKRVKEEARSITANCNIKIFGKLQDPTQTKEFFENQVGKEYVVRANSYQLTGGATFGSYSDGQQATVNAESRADYDTLKNMKEGEAVVSFALDVFSANIFYSNPGHAKAMRVSRYLALPEPDENITKNASKITKLRDAMFNKNWTAMKADVAVETPEEIQALVSGHELGKKHYGDPIDQGIIALSELHAIQHPIDAQEAVRALSEAPPESQQQEQTSPPPQKNNAASQTATTTQAAVDNTPVASSTPPASESTKQATETVSFYDINQEPSGTVEHTTIKRQKISMAAEEILREAGHALRQSLFKTNSSDAPDAAE